MGSSTHDAEYVEQLEFVYNHNITKPELSLSEYRQFHRPRLPLAVVTPACQWIFQSRVIAKSKKSRGITAADGSTMIGSYHSMMAGSKAQSKIKNEVCLCFVKALTHNSPPNLVLLDRRTCLLQWVIT